jgi:hypothetical protein
MKRSAVCTVTYCYIVKGKIKLVLLILFSCKLKNFWELSRMSYSRGGDGKPRGFGFSGFQLKRDRASQLPPPPSSAISKHGYSTMSAISQNALAASYGLPRKRSKTEEE